MKATRSMPTELARCFVLRLDCLCASVNWLQDADFVSMNRQLHSFFNNGADPCFAPRSSVGGATGECWAPRGISV